MVDPLERFNTSCAKFSIQNPYVDDETVETLTNLVKLTRLKDAYHRVGRSRAARWRPGTEDQPPTSPANSTRT